MPNACLPSLRPVCAAVFKTWGGLCRGLRGATQAGARAWGPPLFENVAKNDFVCSLFHTALLWRLLRRHSHASELHTHAHAIICCTVNTR